jgi:hypothetical protein
MGTIKIKSTDKASQGDYVLINEEDFDPDKHEKLTEKQATAADVKDAKAAAGKDKE